jgi:hypothetical protein
MGLRQHWSQITICRIIEQPTFGVKQCPELLFPPQTSLSAERLSV